MSFLLLAGCCALITFAVVNVAASACVLLHWHRRRGAWMHRSASSLLFFRSIPAWSAAGVTLLTVLPAFFIHEPRDRVESVGLPLAIGAGLGMGILLAAVIRSALAIRRTRIEVGAWLESARPVTLPGWSGPAWLVDPDAVGACVVGLSDRTLLISREVVSACTPRELAGILAHETAHAARRDNWKRLLLRAQPDLLGMTSIAAQVERVWEARAEEEADAAAVRGDPALRVEIASALVKLAHIRPRAAAPLAAAFDAGGPIERRVRTLLRGVPSTMPPARPRWIVSFAVFLGPALVCGVAPPLSSRVHLAVEALVRLLA